MALQFEVIVFDFDFPILVDLLREHSDLLVQKVHIVEHIFDKLLS